MHHRAWQVVRCQLPFNSNCFSCISRLFLTHELLFSFQHLWTPWLSFLLTISLCCNQGTQSKIQAFKTDGPLAFGSVLYSYTGQQLSNFFNVFFRCSTVLLPFFFHHLFMPLLRVGQKFLLYLFISVVLYFFVLNLCFMYVGGFLEVLYNFN